MFFFFFNDTATTEIYTLSLHDALPICSHCRSCSRRKLSCASELEDLSIGTHALSECLVSLETFGKDRKSTRLNSSHLVISYAVFCLKKKKYIYLDLE